MGESVTNARLSKGKLYARTVSRSHYVLRLYTRT
jgi:hypothetical protein